MTLARYRAEAGVRSFLSRHNSNPKIAKAEAVLGVSTAVLHLAPANTSGFEVCQSRSPGCTAACLHYAGAPFHQSQKNKSRIARTRYFFRSRANFMDALRREIITHVKRSERKGYKPAVRLNGTSDLPWERIRESFGTLMEAFPVVQFYDYTAVLSRLERDLPPNYHLTFSLKEDNLREAYRAQQLGYNLAAVFSGPLPDRYLGKRVIDGDVHDYRPADPCGVIVGLSAKGALAAADDTGFVSRAVGERMRNAA